MKLSVKIVLATLLVLAITLCASTYFLVQISFRTDLDAQIQSAAENTKMLCLFLGTLAQQNGNETPIVALSDSARGENNNWAGDFSVMGETGEVISRRGSDPVLTPEDYQTGKVTYLLHRSADGTGYTLETMGRLTLSSQGQTTHYYVVRSRDVSRIFAQLDENLKISREVTAVALVVGLIAAILVAQVLMSPIRTLSRSTRAIAQGEYSRRVQIRTHDEMGDLAQDFNHMADALEQRITALGKAARQQRDFTASFTHELKTPMTSIIGYADSLRSRDLSPEQRFDAANYIYNEGKRLETMSFALLDLFALEQNGPVLRLASAEVIAERTAISSRFPLEKKEITLKRDVEPGSFQAEPNLIVTLLYNLVDNARKATAPGGEILLLGRRETAGYRFTVVDHGGGIPAEALDRITEPFYMVDKSRARAEGGAGLGLTLCQKIAEAHGTRLEFSVEDGVGTSVSILLGGEDT